MINSGEVRAAKEGAGTWALESDPQIVAASEQRKRTNDNWTEAPVRLTELHMIPYSILIRGPHYCLLKSAP